MIASNSSRSARAFSSRTHQNHAADSAAHCGSSSNSGVRSTPRELYRAQGFPDNYVIDRGHDGRKLSNKAQVMMVGNSVSPWPMAALIRANMLEDKDDQMEEAA